MGNVVEVYSNVRETTVRREQANEKVEPKKPSPLSSEAYANPLFFALKDVQFGGKRMCSSGRGRCRAVSFWFEDEDDYSAHDEDEK